MRGPFSSLEVLQSAVGIGVATSDWLQIEQSRINLFAEATGDFQWIHVDSERAATGPFGGTIAHGFLTLSLRPYFLGDLLDAGEGNMVLNYGLNRVRFIAPVPVNARLRGVTRLLRVKETDDGAEGEFEVTIEREGSEKPVCIAQFLARFCFGTT
jgi:acyl dehydratase